VILLFSSLKIRNGPLIPPANEPQTIKDTDLPVFLGLTVSCKYFSSEIQNTQICCGSLSFSIEHSLLHLTLAQSSAVQSLTLSAHCNFFLACSFVNFGRFLVNHLYILSSLLSLRRIVLIEILERVLACIIVQFCFLLHRT